MTPRYIEQPRVAVALSSKMELSAKGKTEGVLEAISRDWRDGRWRRRLGHAFDRVLRAHLAVVVVWAYFRLPGCTDGFGLTFSMFMIGLSALVATVGAGLTLHFLYVLFVQYALDFVWRRRHIMTNVIEDALADPDECTDFVPIDGCARGDTPSIELELEVPTCFKKYEDAHESGADVNLASIETHDDSYEHLRLRGDTSEDDQELDDMVETAAIDTWGEETTIEVAVDNEVD
jgi:hypothetical protein